MPLYDQPELRDAPALIRHMVRRTSDCNFFIAEGSSDNAAGGTEESGLKTRTVRPGYGIDTMNIPAGWREGATHSGGSNSYVRYDDPHEQARTITVGTRSGSTEAYNLAHPLLVSPTQVLYLPSWSKDKNRTPRVEKARRLISALTGHGLEWDNSFSNAKNPLYQIDQVSVQDLHGKRGLTVQGKITDKKGNEVSYLWETFFFEKESNGVVLYSVSINSKNKKQFEEDKPLRDAITGSINWH